ncbi:MAG: hypothetical protein JWP01_9 [Myxococcales bacterium]|nr:hypothetical protein [Myxococcales bacterium]
MGVRESVLRAVSGNRRYASGSMRPALIAAALFSLAGCPTSGGSECTTDSSCGTGEVCARDSMCAESSAVRAVVTTWTVQGAEANATTCASHPDLFINFLGRDQGDTLGFTPVPCKLGQFSIDKLPDRFGQVELGTEGGFASEIRSIGSTNSVMIDLR